MTKKKWMEKFRQNEPALLSLIERWHPASIIKNDRVPQPMTVTAVSPELHRRIILACTHDADSRRDAVAEFRAALEEDNWFKLFDLLIEAWLGVPESTECWNVRGFTEAVDLMEDPPEDAP